MKTYRRTLTRLTTPERMTPKDGIAFWQEKVLLILLLITVIVGLITYIPSLALSIKEELWIVAAVDTFLYAFVVFLFLRRDLSFRFRALSIPAISYLLGMVLMITLGPFGAGPVWLFFFPIITGVLLGYRMAIRALSLNALTIAGLGLMIHLEFTEYLTTWNFNPWYMAADNPMEKWIVVSLNFMLLSIAATLSVTTILQGLQQSMADLGLSEKKHRRIFENILDVYFETSPDGIVLEISPSVEKIFQYTPEEIKGQSIFSLYPEGGQWDIPTRQLMAAGFLKDHEIRLKHKNGRDHYCSVNARLIKDEDGRPEKIVGIFRDISQQKAMEHEKRLLEERLNRAGKMESLGLLAGGVAHDLNNILSGVVTYPEILAMDMDKDDPLKKSMDIIHASGLKASEIVQDLLTLSRRGVITREIIDLNTLVSDFLTTPEYQKIISFHPEVRVETELNARMPFLKGSPVHIHKTVMNLVSNAAEAQPGGGKIWISTRNCRLETPLKGYDQIEPGDYIVFSVRDEGTGIEPDDLKRIFEPFFTKKIMGRSGTGLGMAVVWGTVQDHEGYIDVITDIDRGTTFELYFPASAELPGEASAPSGMADLKGNGETILVIDDVPEQRQVASSALECLGYRAVCVESGEKGVAYLREYRADLLLIDMIMEPGIDGLETYTQVLDIRPGQKAIIASGYSQTHQVNQALELGAGAYLKKPYTLRKLGLAVKQELSKPVI